MREALEPAEGFVADGVHLNQARVDAGTKSAALTGQIASGIFEAGSALVAELATHALLEQQGATLRPKSCSVRHVHPSGRCWHVNTTVGKQTPD